MEKLLQVSKQNWQFIKLHKSFSLGKIMRMAIKERGSTKSELVLQEFQFRNYLF